MVLLSTRGETLGLPPEEDPLPSIAEDTEHGLTQDKRNIQELKANSAPWTYSPETRLAYANAEIASRVRSEYTPEQTSELLSFLREKGTFDIPLEQDLSVTLDGERAPLTLMTPMPVKEGIGEMGKGLWARDAVQKAAADRKLSRLNLVNHPIGYFAERAKQGCSILLSELQLFSTDGQLKRFVKTIQLGDKAGQLDRPEIYWKSNNLNGEEPNPWRHAQDALAMEVAEVAKALKDGDIKPTDLTSRNRLALALSIPLFLRVDPRGKGDKNSGSWEEVATPRTSVMGVEVAALEEVLSLVQGDQTGEYDFLRDVFDKCMPEEHDNFVESMRTRIVQRLTTIGHRLPFECPEPGEDPYGVRYREGDAALLLLLKYGVPQLLEKYRIPVGRGENARSMSAIEINHMIFKEVAKLVNPEVGGMNRYKDDSYEAKNFFTETGQTGVRAVKRLVAQEANGGEIDLDKKQCLRGKLFEDSPEAAWSHPMYQWGSTAAECALSNTNPTEVDYYIQVSVNALNQGLRLVTGEGQLQITLDRDDNCVVQPTEPYKTPECMTSIGDERGTVWFASPHNPLYWATAELELHLATLTAALQWQRELRNRHVGHAATQRTNI